MPGPGTAWQALWEPQRGLATAADERRFGWPLLLVTLVAVVFTALAVPRTDYESAALDALDRAPDAAKLTPHERTEKLASARKVAAVGAFARAALWPSGAALLATIFVWLGLKVAGGRPAFAGTFAVLAHAQLPGALREVLSLPALLTRTSLPPGEAARLLPSSLASFAPERTPAPRLALLESLDFFALWAVALVALGMARVAGVSKVRSTVAVVVLWASYVLVFRFALPSMSAGGPHP